MYQEWREYRNVYHSNDAIRANLEDISTLCLDTVNYAFCRFIAEIRKVDGSMFPPRTLYEISVCLQFKLEMLGFTWKLLDDEQFTTFKFTLDYIMKLRCQEGYGNVVKQAEVLSYKDEDILWQIGVLGTDNPTKLMKTLVFDTVRSRLAVS